MFAEQESSLTNMVELDRARKPRIILSKRGWVQADTVVITGCARTTTIDTVDGRPTLGSRLNVQIGDLIRCTVVLQLEDRSCSQCKGHDVYDKSHPFRLHEPPDIGHNMSQQGPKRFFELPEKESPTGHISLTKTSSKRSKYVAKVSRQSGKRSAPASTGLVLPSQNGQDNE
ncbi:hypothetical protein B0H13DRAFT_1891436 [Mycena leptocephala]|nr:hypothetical protein B0H13DRAFT_1891436 [Mycena leptocephala]